MEVTYSNKICVHEYTHEALMWARDNLTLYNPEYIKKSRMGLWVGNTPEKIALYEVNGADLFLPFGCARQVYAMWGGEGHYSPIRAVNYQSVIELYPYQRKAVDAALKRKSGIIVMPCGAGKTQTALEIIARIGGKALWLTHTKDLLVQSMARAQSVFGLSSHEYGTITEGRVNVSTGITFATVQTMAKIDLTAYKDAFDVIVVDECHKAVGSPTKVMQFYKVLSSLSARYKIGITATPKRADGLEKSMFALLGGIMCEIVRADVAQNTCPIKAQIVRTGYYPRLEDVLAGDGTLQYSALVEDLVTCSARTQQIVDHIANKRCMLVLGNRVKFLKEMADMLEERGLKVLCLSNMGMSKAAKEQRKAALKQLNDGELDAVLATYQLAKEGLDVPKLRYVVLATPEKDETTVIQAVGRVGRKAAGKTFGTVIDFVDSFGMYQGWAKKRQAYYRKIEAEVLV